MSYYQELKPVEIAAVDAAMNAAMRRLMDYNVSMQLTGLQHAREALSRAVVDSRPAVQSHSLF